MAKSTITLQGFVADSSGANPAYVSAGTLTITISEGATVSYVPIAGGATNIFGDLEVDLTATAGFSASLGQNPNDETYIFQANFSDGSSAVLLSIFDDASGLDYIFVLEGTVSVPANQAELDALLASFDAANPTDPASGTYAPATAIDPAAITGATLTDEDDWTGTDEDETFDGGAGNDTLDGGAGDDSILGGDDNDDLFGGAGNDTLLGGDGFDTLVGGAGADSLDGGGSNNTASYQTATAGLRLDLIFSGTNTGDAVGDSFSNIAFYRMSDFDDEFYGTESRDFAYGEGGNDLMLGRGGGDILHGMDGNDTLLGMEGNEQLIGGAGADTLNGGAGTDMANYIGAAGFTGLTVDMLYAAASTGEAAGDVLIDVENLRGTLYDDDLRGTEEANEIEGHNGDDIVYARGGNDTLIGGDGSDTLVGMDGDDALLGGAGSDTLNGGAGTDTADYSDAAAAVTADMLYAGGGTSGEAAGDLMIDMENLLGSAFGDELRGTDDANVVDGQDGDDIIYARGGNDTLIGGAGSDTLVGMDGDDVLIGGAGADTLNGGNGTDVADYSDAAAAVTADMLYAGAGTTGDAAGDLMVGVENLIGSAFDDELRGTDTANEIDGGDGDDLVYARDGDDLVTGGAGNDTLVGQDGDDTLIGGAGADTLNGGNGTDGADYSGVAAGLTVDMLYAGVSTGEAAGDVMVDVENLRGTGFDDDLRGTDGANLILGSGGDDMIRGRGGDDTVRGGDGDDSLLGEAGADTFVFGTGAGADVVMDFADDIDALQFDASLLGGGTAQDFVDTFADDSSGVTVIDLGGGNTVTLWGVANAQDIVDDLVFV